MAAFNADPSYPELPLSLRKRGKLSTKICPVDFFDSVAKHLLKPQAMPAAAKSVSKPTDSRGESSINCLDSDCAVCGEHSWMAPERRT